MIRTRLASLLVLPFLGLAACSVAPAPSSAPAVEPATSAPAESGSLLAAHGLEGKSGREIVEALDQDPAQRPLAIMGSVRYDQVVISDGNAEEVVPIEGDEFYLSLAPYESVTHDCYFHNLGTCRGELAGADVHVKITADDGTVLVDEDATTYANGFVGFWVPKDVKGTIVVTKDAKTAESPFSSDAEGATCVTTLPLT